MTKYKIKKGFISDKIDGRVTIFNVSNSTFYSFNQSGSFIFKMIKKGKDKEEMMKQLIKRYKISGKKAIDDINDFLEQLLKNEIIFSLKQKKPNK